MTVKALNTPKWSAEQALIHVQNDDPEVVSIIYRKKGSDNPIVVCSTMKPMEVYFFGGALQGLAMNRIRE